MNYIGGNSIERINKQKRKTLHSMLKNTQQSRTIKTPTNTAYKALITDDNLKSDYDKKIICVDFDSQLKEGDVFEIIDDGSHWMIYLPHIEETAYLRSEIIRCRYTLSIDDEKYWIYFQGPTETDLRWYRKKDINYNILNLSGTIYIKDTPKTRNYFTRFQKIMIEGHTWEIQVTDYITVPGIIELEIQEYYDNSIEELPEIIKEDNKQIIGKDIVRQNEIVGYEIAGKNYKSDFTWFISGNDRVKIKEIQENGLICKVKIEPGAIRKFNINYGTNKDYFTKEVNIDIEENEISGPTEIDPYDIAEYKTNISGKFYIMANENKNLATCSQIDSKTCKIEVLTGKSCVIILCFDEEETGRTIELPIKIKSF